MIQKTKAEIIEETCSYYNSTNRSMSAYGRCQYNGLDGKQCAFSRCCTDPTQLKEDCSVNSLPHYPDYYLKPEYHGHSEDFWMDVQALHDTGRYWNETGLSELGFARKKVLLEIYAD